MNIFSCVFSRFSLDNLESKIHAESQAIYFSPSHSAVRNLKNKSNYNVLKQVSVTVDLWSVVGKSKLTYWGKFKSSWVVLVSKRLLLDGYLKDTGKYFHKSAFLVSKHFDALIRYQLNFLEKKSLFVIKRMPIEIWRVGGGCYGGGGMQFYDVSGPHFVPTRSCSAAAAQSQTSSKSQLLRGGQIENMWIVRCCWLKKTFIPQ